MRRRVRLWAGSVTAVVAALGVAIYLARVGWEEAGNPAGMVGLFVIVVGLAVAGQALAAGPAQGQGAGQRRQRIAGEDAAGPASIVVEGGNTGIASSGDGARNVQQQARASEQTVITQVAGDQTVHQYVMPDTAVRPVAEVVAPPGLVNLPRHTRTFVGRGDELTRLEAVLRGGGGVVVAAVHGLGGVGKSTLAAHYALAQAGDGAGGRNPVWWITADGPGAVEAGLAALAVALQPELTSASPLEALAERARAWLAAHQGWLLVLDNVVDPADVRPLLERPLAGQVLVTSRLGEGWHRLDARLLRLDVLGEREAIDLLTRIATQELPHAGLDAAVVPEGWEGADELVRELGYLPLAIEQAGAYLHQSRLSPVAYLELLRAQPAVMYDRVARGADGERTIARIWRLTLDRLADTPMVGSLLRVLAWYGAEPIPRTLLDGLEDGKGEAEVLHALSELAAYSMIALDQDNITVHRLVQAVARTPDSADPHRQADDIGTACEVSSLLLNIALPEEPRDPAGWPAWRALLPHITALTNHAPAGPDTATTARLLNQTGAFLEDQGAISRAVACFGRAHTSFGRVLGVDHPSTLASRNNLAYAYRASGDWGRAIPLLEATLADYERVLGVDHPDTLTSRNNLAYAYRASGDRGRAIPLLEATLADRERVLGVDHPDTLTSRNNLASAYQASGDRGRAIPLLEATLADCVRVLGVDHPDTLTSRNNLAYAYRASGDWGRAIPLLEATLADYERVLGVDHPSTLASRNNLAYAYQASGDWGRAIPLLEATLADCVRVLGVDHPSTLASRNNLASAYQASGDWGRAIPLLEATLADYERVLGVDHPDTLNSRNNLAVGHESAGDLGRALPLFETTLANYERVLGVDHPDTLTSRNNLASAYQASGDLGRALPLFETTLANYERVLGADHPDTLTSRNNLASAYQASGDLGRALPLFETTLANYERVLGADHPDTLTSRNNLAYAYRAAGDLGRAIPLYKETLADRERVLGADHPSTLASRNNLAYVYRAAGDLGRAIPLYKETLADRERVLGPDHRLTKVVQRNLSALE
ncbi:tetratricopeptide repeat protein [Nonomuraea sp. NPDC050540]|uniref:tetratricopeptide repeat protein n=1 Tax=Nonomuraea sp. NPDC050540 TaxID=3364367 RepID=UPI003790F9E2